MRKFNYKDLEQKKWDNEIVSFIARLHEHKARQDMFLNQKPEVMEKLVELAKIQSTEASNKIEGICTTNERLRELINNKTTPKTRDEEEKILFDMVNDIDNRIESYIKKLLEIGN